MSNFFDQEHSLRGRPSRVAAESFPESLKDDVFMIRGFTNF